MANNFSKNSTLNGKVTLLPFSTKSQPDNPNAYPLNSPLEGNRAWVICDSLTTLAVSRLHMPGKTVPRLEKEVFTNIVKLALGVLPRPDY
ncbi:MAG: type II toxin-antitoxin system PemK/MazF family toxin [Aestuariivita sp.]|nr:type II toxin-antitoxin system PemK/MazF family toxin [Aestuariivita sp.]MCY4203842.1 type II toxin-antitoxin system PemK/MazF family toxin [Aestuariivita sp.]